MKKITLLVVVLFTLLSCRTTEVKTNQISNSLLGVVYDNKSNPVQGAKLLFVSRENTSKKVIVTTDIDGKFLVPSIEFGEYDVEVTSKNCAPVKTYIDHQDIENVLIVKVFTKTDLIELFKKHLFSKNLELAKDKMELIEVIDKKDLYYNYLKSIYYIEAKLYSNAESLLLNLIKVSEDDPYVNLLLADLYQYKLQNNKKALIYLKRYLNLSYSEKEADRIKELQSAK